MQMKLPLMSLQDWDSTFSTMLGSVPHFRSISFCFRWRWQRVTFVGLLQIKLVKSPSQTEIRYLGF